MIGKLDEGTTMGFLTRRWIEDPGSLTEVYTEFFPKAYTEKQSWIDEIVEKAKLEMKNHSDDGTKFQLPEFDRYSKTLQAIKAGATGWKALEIIYNFETDRCKDPLAKFWVNMRNAQAVRNRFRFAKFLLRKAFIQQANNTGKGSPSNPLFLLSLAAGSAQAVLETVSEVREDSDLHVNVVLIDSDMSVRSMIRKRIKNLGLSGRVKFVVGSAFKFGEVIRDLPPPDIVEMLGLLDYLNNKLAVRLCRRIYKQIATGGNFLTCHIHPNPEQDFLRFVINWGHNPYMFYRTIDELKKIALDAGFETVQTHTEPHCIHSIAVCTK